MSSWAQKERPGGPKPLFHNYSEQLRNRKLTQSGLPSPRTACTKNLIFPIPYLVRFISRVMTLNPGDIIATGTPAGIGPMVPGDRVDVQIEGIGVLSNKVMRVK